jgi:hypothetical protein
MKGKAAQVYKRVMAKLSLCLIKHHNMKKYGEV